MISRVPISRRFLVPSAAFISLLVVWSIPRPLPWERPATTKPSEPLPHVADYLEQAYSLSKPRAFPYAGLKETCDHVSWADDAPYLNCVGMLAGITSIISQVKVCLKMAVDSGSHLILPRMPLRSSEDLTAFNFFNDDAYMAYDEWFDDEHLRNILRQACPRMRIIHPSDLRETSLVRNRWSISCFDAPGYIKVQSYFWVGRPFKDFFNEEYRKLQFLEKLDPNRDATGEGITVIDIDSEFLLFRITDDPTQRDLHLWNDLSHLIRFRDQPRHVVNAIFNKITRPYYGVHFRVENDTIWSSSEEQLKLDLDALDRAWAAFGRPDVQKPLVYLACGDQVQVEKFVTAGAGRGWEVTHKWKLTQDDREIMEEINKLPFDFQGVVDMGIMIRADFFLGITGSAFSTTIAHLRDSTGRYRGSSFDIWDDQGARSHLFFEGDTQYACCL